MGFFTAFNSQHKAEARARQTWFFLCPIFGPGVHPLYNTRKGKVYGPFFVAVLKLPALFRLENGQFNNHTKELV